MSFGIGKLPFGVLRNTRTISAKAAGEVLSPKSLYFLSDHISVFNVDPCIASCGRRETIILSASNFGSALEICIIHQDQVWRSQKGVGEGQQCKSRPSFLCSIAPVLSVPECSVDITSWSHRKTSPSPFPGLLADCIHTVHAHCAEDARFDAIEKHLAAIAYGLRMLHVSMNIRKTLRNFLKDRLLAVQ